MLYLQYSRDWKRNADAAIREICDGVGAACGAQVTLDIVTGYDALGGILPLQELKRRIGAGWKTMEVQVNAR